MPRSSPGVDGFEPARETCEALDVSRLVDIGANLTNRAFASDLDTVLARAREADVHPIIVTGTSVEASTAAARLARLHPGRLYATAGVHPHHARDFDADAAAALRGLAALPEVVALGETGLDFHRNLSPRDAQLACFETQLALAAELGLPLFLHERDAHDAFFELLRRWRPKLSRAVVHCFTGSRAELERYLTLDLHIGITGWINDERRGQHLRELVRLVPRDRLLIETDAPYLLPRDLPAKPDNRRNEPAFLRQVSRAVAVCRGESESDVAYSTTQAAVAFFALPPE